MMRLTWHSETAALIAMMSVGGFFTIGCAPANAPQAKPATAMASHDHDHDHDHGKKDGHEDHDHDHDHGEHATHDTLAGAVAELVKISASVKEELGKKNLDDADGHVHMVGHLVEDMHRLVGSAKLSDDAKAAAAKALDEIFDCFDKLDTVLHSSDEKVREAIDYLEHEPRIQAAIEELKKAADAIQNGATNAVGAVEKAAEGPKQSVGDEGADQ
jgi:hypothetical protein